MQRPNRPLFRIALLHLALVPCDVEHNRQLIETAIVIAAKNGAAWIVTPELAVCGYSFAEQLGTDWIVSQPERWMTTICKLAARHRATVFLAIPERDHQSKRLHNAVFVIDDEGRIIGRHRKINTLPVGSEAWSSPGSEIVAIKVRRFGNLGILICADACSPHIARQFREAGAQVLVSAAGWAPGLYGPNGEWERVTLDTGLPLIVCNRTGHDVTMDFTSAQSIVARDGKRLLSLSSPTSTIFLFDWDASAQTLGSSDCRRIEL